MLGACGCNWLLAAMVEGNVDAELSDAMVSLDVKVRQFRAVGVVDCFQ